METDYYAVLGVASSAEDVVLDAARKALLFKYHPDRNAGENAAARSRLVNQAFQILGDPASREAYDRARAAASTPPPTLSQLREARARAVLTERALRFRDRRRALRRMLWLVLIVLTAAVAAASLYDGGRTGSGNGGLSDAALDYLCRR